ncbi:hypothetical protein ACNFJ7_11160 [Sphingomonas sp. HT-1]|uniref:hypothetical protein n=1 Tax=unclassified Sphingomonas TaxID=196159 RepID=UPI0004745C9D|nr:MULTISPECIES: hypothetical protein [unclassified Sphingomonas]KTF68895.1 hypothetical protein ATB93_11730 [Sphingomonas sp. WG]
MLSVVVDESGLDGRVVVELESDGQVVVPLEGDSGGVLGDGLVFGVVGVVVVWPGPVWPGVVLWSIVWPGAV